MSAKVVEALEHIKAAEKMLRTSLLRWRPDYDSAADEYNQAAQCYRIARELKQSKECHLKASENYKLNRSFFHAAKALENAIIVGRDICPAEEIYGYACEAASLYQQHGSGDSGAAVLAKAARILEEAHPEKAYKLFQQAAEASFSESSTHSAVEYTSKASRILVKLQQYDAAMDSVRLEIGYHLQGNNFGAVGRLVVIAVLIQLARGDLVAAEKVYKEWANNCEQAEQVTVEMLLQGMDENDPELVQRGLTAPFIRSMDVEYARLASIIPLPQGDRDALTGPGVRMGAELPYVSGMASQAQASVDHGYADHVCPMTNLQLRIPTPTLVPFTLTIGRVEEKSIKSHRFEDIQEDPLEGVNQAGRSDGGGLC